MQSFLQYRKLGITVRKQIEKDYEKGQPCEMPELSAQQRASIFKSTTGLIDNSAVNPDLERICSITTIHIHNSRRTTLGHALHGIHARERTMHEGKNGKVFVVGWEGENDPLNPRNWSVTYRVCITLLVTSISFAVGAATSTDTAVLPQAAADFGVSDVVESITIGKSCLCFPMLLHRNIS